jgi:hypothetical protein
METSVSERSADKREKLETAGIHSANSEEGQEPTSTGSLEKEEGPEPAGTITTETGRTKRPSKATSLTLLEEQELSERFGQLKREDVDTDGTFTMVRCVSLFSFYSKFPLLFFKLLSYFCLNRFISHVVIFTQLSFNSTEFPRTQTFTPLIKLS